MPWRKRISNVIGVDDGPCRCRANDPCPDPSDVLVVGTVFAKSRLDGLVTSTVTRDGDDATEKVAGMITGSRFLEHAGAILLQGIALAGFNVVDIRELNRKTGLPVVVVARRQPNLEAIRSALLERVPGGPEKWALIEQAGPMEPLGEVWVQRAGISWDRTRDMLSRCVIHGHIPEAIRTAHLIATGVVLGESRGGA